LAAGRADKQDVINVTEAFRVITKGLFHKTPLDKKFKEHLDFVFNQILQQIRKNGLTAHASEFIGKMLFRLWNVYKAYISKKKEYTPSELFKEAVNIGNKIFEVLGIS